MSKQDAPYPLMIPNDTDLLQLKPFNYLDCRFYWHPSLPEPYPSVTTVLSVDPEKQKGLASWRNRVGAEEAQRVMKEAADNGTIVHNLMEDFLLGDNSVKNATDLHKWQAFGLQEVFSQLNVQEIWGVELSMHSHHLRVAGTADAVAKIDHSMTLVDWKTSRKKKKRDWIKSYFMQKSAYCVAFEELTGFPVSDMLTAIVNSDYTVDLFWEKRDDWIGKFKEIRALFDREYSIDWSKVDIDALIVQ